MNRIVHYTSNKKWEKIKKSGALLPKSDPDLDEINARLSDRVNALVRHARYLVGMPCPLHEGWVEYGLMEYVLKHSSGEVVLNVPVLQREGSFVRDHVFLSPKRTIEVYGEDLWKAAFENESVDPDDPRIQEIMMEYVESSVSLADYQGDYKVPEIWLPQSTPVDRLTKI